MSTNVNRKISDHRTIERIALGSIGRRRSWPYAPASRGSEIDAAWRSASIVARPVKTDAPSMPLTDWELMIGARQRRWRAQNLLEQKLSADLYVGLKAGSTRFR
jgi:hypothetical protein